MKHSAASSAAASTATSTAGTTTLAATSVATSVMRPSLSSGTRPSAASSAAASAVTSAASLVSSVGATLATAMNMRRATPDRRAVNERREAPVAKEVNKQVDKEQVREVDKQVDKEQMTKQQEDAERMTKEHHTQKDKVQETAGYSEKVDKLGEGVAKEKPGPQPTGGATAAGEASHFGFGWMQGRFTGGDEPGFTTPRRRSDRRRNTNEEAGVRLNPNAGLGAGGRGFAWAGEEGGGGEPMGGGGMTWAQRAGSHRPNRPNFSIMNKTEKHRWNKHQADKRIEAVILQGLKNQHGKRNEKLVVVKHRGEEGERMTMDNVHEALSDIDIGAESFMKADLQDDQVGVLLKNVANVEHLNTLTDRYVIAAVTNSCVTLRLKGLPLAEERNHWAEDIQRSLLPWVQSVKRVEEEL